jgi:hypothetical protein
MLALLLLNNSKKEVIMKGIVYLFVGIVLIATAILFSQSSTRVRINHKPANAEDSNIARYGIGGGLAGLGLIFAIGGLISMVRGSKQNKRTQYILQNGIDAQGTVTFVDKNWYIKVNGNPIYSIVEYTYPDETGLQHTRRITNISSEIVIRKQIQVGSTIPIKYTAENPEESVIVLSS